MTLTVWHKIKHDEHTTTEENTSLTPDDWASRIRTYGGFYTEEGWVPYANITFIEKAED